LKITDILNLFMMFFCSINWKEKKNGIVYVNYELHKMCTQ